MRNTESDPPKGTTGAVVRWAAVGVAGVTAVGGLLWAVGSLSLPMRSASGVATRTLDPDNVIATYERFHDRAKGFEARLSQIAGTSRLWTEEADPRERSQLGIELRAQRQSCRDIAAGYNADAAKTNRAIFAGREAPERLNEVRCEQ